MTDNNIELPELTEAEKQALVIRAAQAPQEITYEAAASARAIANAGAQKYRRAFARLRQMAAGGFVYHPPVQSRPNVPISYARAERHREQFGRL